MADVHYTLAISEDAIAQFRSLPKDQRRRIAERKPGKLTLQSIYGEMLRLREREEDLEDLRELNVSIARNGKKKLVPWDSAKRMLGLED